MVKFDFGKSVVYMYLRKNKAFIQRPPSPLERSIRNVPLAYGFGTDSKCYVSFNWAFFIATPGFCYDCLPVPLDPLHRFIPEFEINDLDHR